MTSLRLHYRASSKPGRQAGSLFIRVIHKRRVKNISLGFNIYPEEWNPYDRQLIYPADENMRRAYLLTASETIRFYMDSLKKSVSSLNSTGDFTVEQIIAGFRGEDSPDSLASYANGICRRLDNSGQERTSRAYLSAVRSLRKYLCGKDIALYEIDRKLILGYEQYLLQRGLMMNTISFYMRNLRAIYYRAVKDKLIELRRDNPFEDVFTGVHETRRRALSRQEMNSLSKLEQKFLRENSESGTHGTGSPEYLRRSLYYFLFCYHARGMSYVDMTYLRKHDITKDTILYKRRKTGAYLEVKITRPMRVIINYFNRINGDSAFVFPIIDESRGKLRTQYENGLRLQNKHLKQISAMAGLKKNLSTHVSRHTWATLAKWSKVHISLISEALGHRDIKTTQTYLASFERSTLDQLSVKLSSIIQAA